MLHARSKTKHVQGKWDFCDDLMKLVAIRESPESNQCSLRKKERGRS